MPDIFRRILVAPGLALPEFMGPLNMRSTFGARGDGVTDDTDAFERAINFLNLIARLDLFDYGLGGGGELYIPRGLYLLTRDLPAIIQDAVRIRGAGIGSTTLLVRIATSPSTTDFLKVGNGTGAGRRVKISNLSIVSDSNYGASPGFRDGIYIDSSTWPKMKNVVVRGAARYGLRVGGTLGGTFENLHMMYNGDSGVRLEASSGGVELTTPLFTHLYAQNNVKFGVHLGPKTIGVVLSGGIIEFNGDPVGGGTPANGSGIRMGDVGSEADADVSCFGTYFENNAGWDVETGFGLTGFGIHRVHMYGGRMSVGPAKGVGFGGFFGKWAFGESVGMQLINYTSVSYSVDNTCKFDILGDQGLSNTAQPVNRSGSINAYIGGIIRWRDAQGGVILLGSYRPRAGGPASGASVALGSAAAAPATGTWETGDVVLNTAPAAGQPVGWSCTAGGTPGTWRAWPNLT